ncbi:substrate-binding domain-containing protein [Alkaliphilus peptidifermentans]|uniref:Tungstate transport system substrate-binding protein n=1 Tax=Alkaliphilus peptidifermentans DSM 18978 TaxID=1120976 RepID=A0A1G5J7D2_9FIRM|nr:substrate-binding domain-containing protein [Alkaliphilus peptidifermentans]SCY84283.1 tungstate transport system substrate-binding protein [Alkaliphilus peptidifermentans DSM 18978]
MKKYKYPIIIIVFLILLAYALMKTVNSQISTAEEVANGANTVMLATTTSTENSGLIDFLIPYIQEDTGVDVKVISVGTGQALKLGETGEVDILLVHSKAAEEVFVSDGHGIDRFDVMYNDFVLIGPKSDFIDIRNQAKGDILKALHLIYETQTTFLSRGDDSGTHKAELTFWRDLNLVPKGNWYLSTGQGMGQIILMTDELQGYALVDRGTFLTLRDKTDLEIIIEGDSRLYNQYGIIAVNPEKHNKINNFDGQQIIDWILSEKGQQLIGEFGIDEYGESIFIPNAKR